MWFIGVEVEQETSAPRPKKILDPPLNGTLISFRYMKQRVLKFRPGKYPPNLNNLRGLHNTVHKMAG